MWGQPLDIFSIKKEKEKEKKKEEGLVMVVWKAIQLDACTENGIYIYILGKKKGENRIQSVLDSPVYPKIIGILGKSLWCSLLAIIMPLIRLKRVQLLSKI